MTAAQVIHVYEINDPDYTHAALATRDGCQLPMGAGRGKGQGKVAAVTIAASSAGFAAGAYTVNETQENQLFKAP